MSHLLVRGAPAIVARSREWSGSQREGRRAGSHRPLAIPWSGTAGKGSTDDSIPTVSHCTVSVYCRISLYTATHLGTPLCFSVHRIVHYSTYQHTPYLIQLVCMYLSENLYQGIFKNARLQSLQLMKHFLCPKQWKHSHNELRLFYCSLISRLQWNPS